MGTQKTRQEKIEYLKSLISDFFKKKPQGKISKSKLLSEFALSKSSTIRTGEDILFALNCTNFIKINGDDITQ